MGKKKGKRKTKISSGGSKLSRINRLIRRASMKINRWNRYKEEIEAGQRVRIRTWDTSGLENYVHHLQGLL